MNQQSDAIRYLRQMPGVLSEHVILCTKFTD